MLGKYMLQRKIHALKIILMLNITTLVHDFFKSGGPPLKITDAEIALDHGDGTGHHDFVIVCSGTDGAGHEGHNSSHVGDWLGTCQ